MQGLGAALFVSILIAAIIIAGILVVTPSLVKIKQLEYQIQLSHERMSNSNNTTKVILGGIFGAVIAGVVGMYLYASGRAEARDLEARRLELEAQLKLAEIKAQAYRQALMQAEQQAYCAQLPVGSDHALAHPRR